MARMGALGERYFDTVCYLENTKQSTNTLKLLDENTTAERVGVELLAEFLGTMLFAIFGGATASAVGGALGNGMALTVLIFVCASTSGGKLNPAVTLSFILTGTMPMLHGFLEMGFQISGAAAGAAVVKALVVDPKIQCFLPPASILVGDPERAVSVTGFMVFGWELLITVLLILTVYVTAVESAGANKFSSTAPIAIGLSLFAGAAAAGQYTGGCANPARYLGPIMAGGCGHIGTYFVPYLLAHVGAALTGAFFYNIRHMFGQHNCRPKKEAESSLA